MPTTEDLMQQSLSRTRLERQAPPPTNLRKLTLDKRYKYASGEQLDDKLSLYRGIKPDDEGVSEFLKVARTGDKIGPGLNRFVAGVLGLDPEWSIKRSDSDVTSEILEGDTETDDPETQGPSNEDLTLARELNELEDTMTVWHRQAKVHEVLKDAYRYSLWGGLSELRQYIPDIYADDARVIGRSFSSVEEALSVIYFQAIDPRYAGPVVDEHGNTLGHWYEYEEEATDKINKATTFIELHVDKEIRRYREDSIKGFELVDTAANPFYREGERPDFLMHTEAHPSGGVLDESIIDEQDSLNESKVEMRRNGQMGGHRQLILINAQKPTDELGNEIAYSVGPSVAMHVYGYEYLDSSGNKAITTPSVIVVPPVDPENFIKAIKHHTFEILSRFSQTHLEADFLAISGESKKDSRSSWEEMLELEAAAPADALAWAIRNGLRFAYWLTGKDDGKYDDYEVIPSLKLAISSADMATVMDASTLVERNHMSLQGFIEQNPLVQGKEGEKAQLKREAKERAANAPVIPAVPADEEVTP